MKLFLLTTALLLLLAGCSRTPLQTSQLIPTETPELQSENPPTTTAGLFLDTDDTGPVDNSPSTARYRFVKFDSSALIDENGQALDIGEQREITLNLFPDVTYTGVIVQVGEDGGAVSWSGYLKDIEYSELAIVYTAGVFFGHFASPLGIYEVSSVGDDLYRIIQIDQSRLPGGEG